MHIRQVLASHLFGGAGLIGLALATHVRTRGAASSLWVPGPGPATERLDAEHLRWTQYPLHELSRGGPRQALALARIFGRLAMERPTVWHVHNPTIYGWMSPALRLQARHVAVHFHIDPTPESVRWALRHPPSTVVTCSNHIANIVRSAMAEAQVQPRVVPIQNAIDLERFRPSDRSAAKVALGAAPDRPLLVMLANLAPHKGQKTVLRTLRRLADRGVKVDAWFAGEERGGAGTFTRELYDATADLGLEQQVRWLGYRSDGPALLAAADFFLLPSHHEGLPLSVLEAQATGTVVLGSNIPGIAEVVEDGVTGFLADPEADEVFAERVAMLLAHPDLYGRVREAALAHVRERHSWDGYLRQVWDVYAAIGGTVMSGRSN